jgi:hypothetical protein
MMMSTLVNSVLSIRLCALALITLAAPAVFSQTISTGEITGVVVDPVGKVVIGAMVQLKSTDTGESRAVQSNASGVYRFPFVKPGAYEVSAKSEGLKSDKGSLVVAVGQVQVLDLPLKLEDARTVVLVTDAAPLLNPDNDNLVYTLSSRQLDLLPLPGGDLIAVAYSTPGVVINNQRTNDAVGVGNFVVQGIGSVSNLFTVNGIDDMDPYYDVNNSGTTGMLLGANEVQEASVIQNAFEGQYGRQAGAQVNYVTKSGTNFYHGNLLYSYNGSRLNANDFFANATGTPRPRTIGNQYAASLGGPVMRDKLFFFADTEGDRFVLPITNHVVVIPSPELESYALRRIQPSQVPFYQRMFDLYNNAPGVDRAVPVTTGNGLLQDSSGKLGCGKLAGTPTGTGAIFGVDAPCALAWDTNASRLTSEWLLSSRFDYNVSANQRIFFRFKTDQGLLPFVTSDVSPLFDAISRQPDYEGQVNHTLVITPRLVNNFVGSANYNNYVFFVPNLAAAIQAFPVRIQIYAAGANGGPFAQVGPPRAEPFGRRADQFQIIDDISYSTGSHFFRAGVNYRYNPEADLAYANVNVGKFQVRTVEFASGALQSPISNFSQTFNDDPVHRIRLYNLGVYVQDQWAPTLHLKIAATIRLERTGNPYCVNRCFARLTEPFPDLSKGLLVPYNQSIEAGQAHAFYKVEPVVPEPRFSLEYSPGWSHGMVFRAGVGLFSDLYPAFFAGTLGGNPPEFFAPVIHTGLINAGGPGSAPAFAAASAKAFQSGFTGGDTLTQIQQAVDPAPFAPPQYYSVPSTVRSSKSLQWSFEIQRQLGTNNVLALRYMGNHGYDIFTTDPNANASADLAVYPNGFAGLPAETPDPRFSTVQQLTNSGYSSYQALLINFRRAFAHGFQGQISYNWSHALDTLSNGGLLSFGYDSLMGQINPVSLRSLNYSNADYDARHNLTADFIWEMPLNVKNRVIDTVFGRWSFGTKLSAHTGTPFSVTNGDALPSASFRGVVLADVTGTSTHTACGPSAVNMPCFTASQFAPPATQADFGNLPRNSFRGPGFFNIDSSLFKTIPVREGMRLTFGASAYNLFNHPNFANPSADVASPGLGLITSTKTNPSGPYGYYGGPSGRTLVVTGKLVF